jgi:hypothetical protein
MKTFNKVIWADQNSISGDTPELRLFRYLIIDSIEVCLKAKEGKKVIPEDLRNSVNFLSSISPEFIYNAGFTKPNVVIKLIDQILSIYGKQNLI